MWRCPQCGEGIEDQFTSCWSCGYDQEGGEDPVVEPPPLPPRATYQCERCQVPLEARGEMPIRVGGPEEGWHLFREWDEMNERLWKLDVYVCPHCKRVTFFESLDD
jgi:hypothetical protein